jgi:alkanesulfonate monooxygenase SsuD/methylene tetrahydromethanopterin reductase-like flavin-dependent oxidoreductase (luciferase family)
VNANIALVSSFSIHEDRAEAIRRGQEGFEFFGYALQSLVARDCVPGRSKLWERFSAERQDRTEKLVELAKNGDPEQFGHAPGIGTPEDFAGHVRAMQDSGVDQVVLMQQSGKNRHDHICEALELFAQEVLPEFVDGREVKEARKAEELAPYIEAALARKLVMPALEDDEIPVVRASAARAQVNRGSVA